jgi:hypothetical protein
MRLIIPSFHPVASQKFCRQADHFYLWYCSLAAGTGARLSITRCQY